MPTLDSTDIQNIETSRRGYSLIVFVSALGNDGNDGLSINTSVLTLGQAIFLVNDAGIAGQSLIVLGPGTWNEANLAIPCDIVGAGSDSTFVIDATTSGSGCFTLSGMSARGITFISTSGGAGTTTVVVPNPTVQFDDIKAEGASTAVTAQSYGFHARNCRFDATIDNSSDSAIGLNAILNICELVNCLAVANGRNQASSTAIGFYLVGDGLAALTDCTGVAFGADSSNVGMLTGSNTGAVPTLVSRGQFSTTGGGALDVDNTGSDPLILANVGYDPSKTSGNIVDQTAKGTASVINAGDISAATGSSLGAAIQSIKTNYQQRPAPNTWYVSPSGNDGNPGTAVSPFASIGHAQNVANSTDLIRVLPGSYEEDVIDPNCPMQGSGMLNTTVYCNAMYIVSNISDMGFTTSQVDWIENPITLERVSISVSGNTYGLAYDVSSEVLLRDCIIRATNSGDVTAIPVWGGRLDMRGGSIYVSSGGGNATAVDFGSGSSFPASIVDGVVIQGIADGTSYAFATSGSTGTVVRVTSNCQYGTNITGGWIDVSDSAIGPDAATAANILPVQDAAFAPTSYAPPGTLGFDALVAANGVGAISAVTDQFRFTIANQVDANALSGSGLTQQQVADALKLTPTAGTRAAGSAQKILDTLVAGSTGAGNTPVNHDTGGTDNLRIEVMGAGVDAATIRAYLYSDWTANATTATLLGSSTTGPDGRWLDPIYLTSSNSYAIVVDKPGVFSAQTREVTI